ncbi:hypothetical protein ACFX11_034440 [Malus domestica]
MEADEQDHKREGGGRDKAKEKVEKQFRRCSLSCQEVENSWSIIPRGSGGQELGVGIRIRISSISTTKAVKGVEGEEEEDRRGWGPRAQNIWRKIKKKKPS